MNLAWLERSVPQGLTVSIVREVVRKHSGVFYPLRRGCLWFKLRLQQVAIILLLEVIMALSRAWLLRQHLGVVYVGEVCILVYLFLELLDLHLMDILLDLLSQQLSQLVSNVVFLREGLCQLVWVIAFVDEDVVILPFANLDGER